MVVDSKPVECVLCPKSGLYVPTHLCPECPVVVEVRRPWRYYAVRCDPLPKDFNIQNEILVVNKQ